MILWPQNRHLPTSILAHQPGPSGWRQPEVCLEGARDGSRRSSFDQPFFLMDPPRGRSGFGVEKDGKGQ